MEIALLLYWQSLLGFFLRVQLSNLSASIGSQRIGFLPWSTSATPRQGVFVEWLDFDHFLLGQTAKAYILKNYQQHPVRMNHFTEFRELVLIIDTGTTKLTYKSLSSSPPNCLSPILVILYSIDIQRSPYTDQSSHLSFPKAPCIFWKSARFPHSNTLPHKTHYGYYDYFHSIGLMNQAVVGSINYASHYSSSAIDA